MLQQAERFQAYDALHHAELTHFLAGQNGAFDAVVSADTLCYFGALEGALAAAHRCLRPGGWLVFTVEALANGDARDHALQANGRYAHGQSYLQAATSGAGFQSASATACVLRDEAGRPVHGWLVGARKPAQG
jgi:predicted TPR repeat methyltransferase